jgi:hypothetical protein
MSTPQGQITLQTAITDVENTITTSVLTEIVNKQAATITNPQVIRIENYGNITGSSCIMRNDSLIEMVVRNMFDKTIKQVMQMDSVSELVTQQTSTQTAVAKGPAELLKALGDLFSQFMWLYIGIIVAVIVLFTVPIFIVPSPWRWILLAIILIGIIVTVVLSFTTNVFVDEEFPEGVEEECKDIWKTAHNSCENADETELEADITQCTADYEAYESCQGVPSAV